MQPVGHVRAVVRDGDDRMPHHLELLQIGEPLLIVVARVRAGARLAQARRHQGAELNLRSERFAQPDKIPRGKRMHELVGTGEIRFGHGEVLKHQRTLVRTTYVAVEPLALMAVNFADARLTGWRMRIRAVAGRARGVFGGYPEPTPATRERAA